MSSQDMSGSLHLEPITESEIQRIGDAVFGSDSNSNSNNNGQLEVRPSQPSRPSNGAGRGKVGLGKGGARRHRRILRDNINGVTKAAIRKLARRGGVKRINALVYDMTRQTLKSWLHNVIRDTVEYTEYGRRKTVTALDVILALKKKGTTLYI